MEAHHLMRNCWVLICAITVAASFLSACAPYVSEYRYISLEGSKGIRVLEHSKVDLNGLIFHESMPVKYELPKDRYVLHFEVDKHSYLPTMIVTIKSKLELAEKLTLSPIIDPDSCGSYRNIVLKDAEGLKFLWRECPEDGPQGMRALTFQVKNESGFSISNESVEFDIVENGYYVILDAI